MNKKIIEKQVIENATKLDKIIADGLYILYCGEDAPMSLYKNYSDAIDAGERFYKHKGFVVRQLTSVVPKFPDYVKV